MKVPTLNKQSQNARVHCTDDIDERFVIKRLLRVLFDLYGIKRSGRNRAGKW